MKRLENCTILLGLVLTISACASSIGRTSPQGTQQDSSTGNPAGDAGRADAMDSGKIPPKPDQYVPPPSCKNGNLLASFPKLPQLCRPFPAPSPAAVVQDPPTCVGGAQKSLSSGPDQFTGQGWVKDSILGMDGDDTLKGMNCSDTMNGNAGNDYLNGNLGNDTLYGGSGQDTIRGGVGNDLVYGGRDNDLVGGDFGDDQYFIAQGHGADTLEESGGLDSIVCASLNGAPRPSLMNWAKVASDLLLSFSGGTSVQVKNYYAAATYSIDAILNCQ